MITLSSFADAPAPLAPELTLSQIADELCSRVLDCAVFYGWRFTGEGARIPLFQLKKPLQGLPAGHVLPLSELHHKLAAGLYAK